jgi:hypothetical protein
MKASYLHIEDFKLPKQKKQEGPRLRKLPDSVSLFESQGKLSPGGEEDKLKLRSHIL